MQMISMPSASRVGGLERILLEQLLGHGLEQRAQQLGRVGRRRRRARIGGAGRDALIRLAEGVGGGGAHLVREAVVKDRQACGDERRDGGHEVDAERGGVRVERLEPEQLLVHLRCIDAQPHEPLAAVLHVRHLPAVVGVGLLLDLDAVEVELDLDRRGGEQRRHEGLERGHEGRADDAGELRERRVHRAHELAVLGYLGSLEQRGD
jgi:hypothetical protein